MRVVDKAFAYVTRGERLLVFEHVAYPEAGLQVPAGTILPGERAATAAVREAREETGLQSFLLPVPLGVTEFDARPFGKLEIHRRHFFHLALSGDAPERWRHDERDATDGAHEPIAFELYWLTFAEAAARLIAEHGKLIPALQALASFSR